MAGEGVNRLRIVHHEEHAFEARKRERAKDAKRGFGKCWFNPWAAEDQPASNDGALSHKAGTVLSTDYANDFNRFRRGGGLKWGQCYQRITETDSMDNGSCRAGC